MSATKSPTCASVALALTLWMHPALAQETTQPSLWFSPPSDLPSPRGFVRDADYSKLFETPITWPNAIKHVKTFCISHTEGSKKPDNDLRRIFAFLNANHLALGVECPLVDVNVNGRGQNVEGVFHTPHMPLAFANRLKNLGAHVDYIIADEPLCFAHYFVKGASKVAGKPERIGPQYPIEQLAEIVAASVREIQQVFPAAKFVETEPLTGLGSMEEFSQWLVALKKNLNDIPFEGMDIDVQWEKPWQKLAKEMIATIKQNGLPYGLIVDGGPHDPSDVAWVQHAQRNLDEWIKTVGTPNRLMFQSWHERPSHVLPENDPETILSLINAYIKDHPATPPGARVSY